MALCRDGRHETQCFNPKMMTRSVAWGSCSARPDWLSSLQLARFTTLADSVAAPAAPTGSTILSPWLSRKNVCSPNKSLSWGITGWSSGMARASNWPNVRSSCAELSFIARSFRFAPGDEPRDIARSRVAGASHLRGGQRKARSSRAAYLSSSRTPSSDKTCRTLDTNLGTARATRRRKNSSHFTQTFPTWNSLFQGPSATCPFDMPRLRNQLELLLSKPLALNTVPASVSRTSRERAQRAKEGKSMQIFTRSTAAVLLIAGGLLGIPAANAQVQPPAPGASDKSA